MVEMFSLVVITFSIVFTCFLLWSGNMKHITVHISATIRITNTVTLPVSAFALLAVFCQPNPLQHNEAYTYDIRKHVYFIKRVWVDCEYLSVSLFIDVQSYSLLF